MPNMGIPTFLQMLGLVLSFQKNTMFNEKCSGDQKGRFGSSWFLDIP